MSKRVISTLILWTVTIVCFFAIGPDAAVWLLACLSGATQFEFYGLMEKMGRHPFKKLGTVLGLVIILAPYYANKFADSPIAGGIQSGIIAVTIVACCIRIFRERRLDERIESLAATLLGIIYVPFMLNFLVRMIELPGDPGEGLMLVVWLVVTAKFTDVGALLSGKAFGRHPMSPVSPKKTWEGAIGGCVLSVCLGWTLSYFARDAFPPFFTPLWGTILALPMAVLSIVSDLVESMLKRLADQKDSGSVIPGIGGAFDLTDSLILTAPTGYLLFGLLALGV